MADTHVLNPTTPMAYLLPWMADFTTLASYVVVGVLGAVVWDIAIHIDQDFKLLFKCPLSFKTGIYFLSRESTLIFALLNTILQTTPMDGCRTMQNILLAFYYISAGSTALLAYLLCQNLRNKITIALLFVSWLSVLAGAIVLTFGVTNGFPIGPSGYCSYGFVSISSGVAPTTFALHNTFLFFLNAKAQISNGNDDDMGITTASKSEQLFTLSTRAVYDNGQSLFLISVLLNWALVIFCFLRINPPSLWWSFLIVDIAVPNLLFCHVHRVASVDGYSSDASSNNSSRRRTLNLDAPMTFADPATLSKGSVEDSVWTRKDPDSRDDPLFLDGEKPRIYSRAFPV